MKTGRWIYCKYCGKNVTPKLGGIYQIICSRCEYGLTPDFFSAKALGIYLKTEDYGLAMSCDDEKIARDALLLEPWHDLMPSSDIQVSYKYFVCTHKPQIRARKISEMAISNYNKNLNTKNDESTD